MKRGFAAAVLSAACLAASVARADGMAGNTQFLIGQTYLHDFWKPLDEPSSFGVEVDFAPEKSPVHVALGFNVAGDSKHVSVPYFGQTGHVGAGLAEFSAGFVWHPVKKAVVRPYIGAGIVRIFAGVGSGSDFWSGGDTDQSFGFYGNAGVFFKVGDTFNIGLDGRIVRGTSISLAGLDGNVDYGQASLLLGFSWGGGGSGGGDAAAGGHGAR
jgi:hypothetical protein